MLEEREERDESVEAKVEEASNEVQDHKSIFSKVAQSSIAFDRLVDLKTDCGGDACSDRCLLSSPKILVPLDGKIWRSISARAPKEDYDLGRARLHTTSARAREIPARAFDGYFQASALINGLIHVRTSDNNLHLELSLDRALRVFVPKHNILISVSGTATSTAILHPNGKLLQHNSRVDLVARDSNKRNDFVRFAKIWFKGITFTSNDSSLVYLVDAAGVRSTADKFLEVTAEHANEVFFRDCQFGLEYFERASKALEHARVDSSDSIEINHVRISRSSDIISIQRPNSKCAIKINQTTGSVALTTTTFHCTATLGPAPHIFVKRNDRRIHFNGLRFCVRNAGHSAGFDERNQFRIFT